MIYKKVAHHLFNMHLMCNSLCITPMKIKKCLKSIKLHNKRDSEKAFLKKG